MSFEILPGLILPGQRANEGTRYAPGSSNSPNRAAGHQMLRAVNDVSCPRVGGDFFAERAART
jgi:hypothetical protein